MTKDSPMEDDGDPGRMLRLLCALTAVVSVAVVTAVALTAPPHWLALALTWVFAALGGLAGGMWASSLAVTLEERRTSPVGAGRGR